jgi:hypothetical protein
LVEPTCWQSVVEQQARLLNQAHGEFQAPLVAARQLAASAAWF